MTASYINYSGGIHILQLDTIKKEVTIFQENGDPLSDKENDIRWKFPILSLGNTTISGNEFKNDYTLKYSYKDKIKAALGGPDKYVSITNKDNFNLNQNLFGEPRNTGFLKEEKISISPESTNTSSDDNFDPASLRMKFANISYDDDDDESHTRELNYLMEGIHSTYIKGNNFDEQVFASLLDILIDEIEKINFIETSMKDVYTDHAKMIEYTYNFKAKNFETHDQNKHNIWQLLTKLQDAISSIQEEKDKMV